MNLHTRLKVRCGFNATVDGRSYLVVIPVDFYLLANYRAEQPSSVRKVRRRVIRRLQEREVTVHSDRSLTELKLVGRDRVRQPS